MELIKLTLTGLMLGGSIVIPGISAGTMAVVFNIYDRLIGIITPNIKKILASWKFWLPIAIGVIAGVNIVSKIISILYENYQMPTVWFFIGVIIGSIPLIYKRTCQASASCPSLSAIISAVAAFAVMVAMIFLSPNENTSIYTELTPHLITLLFLGGFFAAIAMVIPGISGAFLLLIIGMYQTIVTAVSDLNVPFLAVFSSGVIAGLLIGAAFIRYLLEKAPRETYGAVLGLVAGSVIVLFPGGFGDGITIIISIATLLAGSALSFFMGNQKN